MREFKEGEQVQTYMLENKTKVSCCSIIVKTSKYHFNVETAVKVDSNTCTLNKSLLNLDFWNWY